MAVAGTQLIGFSNGFFISVSSSSVNLDIRAINPLTGARLHLPPAPLPARFDVKLTNVILSPSLHIALLFQLGESGESGARFARLSSSSSSSWISLPLPRAMSSIESCVFHKGGLVMVDGCGDFVIFDEHFFDSPSSFSAPKLWHTRDYMPGYEWDVAVESLNLNNGLLE